MQLPRLGVAVAARGGRSDFPPASDEATEAAAPCRLVSASVAAAAAPPTSATDEAQRAFELGLSLDDAGNAQRAAAVLARMRRICSTAAATAGQVEQPHLRAPAAQNHHLRRRARDRARQGIRQPPPFAAKLLPLMLEGASMLFHPAETAATSRASTAHTCCCGPGRASVPAASVREWLAAQPGRVTLNVLDGTWNQAKGLARRVPPSVVRVNVDDLVSEPSSSARCATTRRSSACAPPRPSRSRCAASASPPTSSRRCSRRCGCRSTRRAASSAAAPSSAATSWCARCAPPTRSARRRRSWLDGHRAARTLRPLRRHPRRDDLQKSPPDLPAARPA